MTHSARRPRSILATIGAITVFALAACSGQSSSSGPAAPGAVGAKDQAAAAGAPSAAGGAANVDAVNAAQKVVRSATLTVVVSSVEQSAVSIRAIAAGAGGQVTGENLSSSAAVPTPTASSSGSARRGSSATITLDVPSDSLDTVLDQLGKLGTVSARTVTSKDVTATYVDTESRISTKKASIERVRTLMTQAKDVAQVVELESQLAQRESDLESLQATLETLKKQVAMSTVTMTLTTEPAAAPDDTSGFLGGLKSGWSAFLTTGNGVLTVAGAVLPFVLALAVVGLPVLWWLRRRRAGAATAAAPPREASLVGAAYPSMPVPSVPTPSVPPSTASAPAAPQPPTAAEPD